MAMTITLQFEPSLITKCACDCEGLCVDCKDETKFLLPFNHDSKTEVAEVIREIRIRYGCKDPIYLYVHGSFVPEYLNIGVLKDQVVVVKGPRASASVSLSSRPAVSAGRPPKTVGKDNTMGIQTRNLEKIGTKTADEIEKGSSRPTIIKYFFDIRFLDFMAKMSSTPTVYTATGKKYHWVRKASHPHRDLAAGHVIKFKAEAKLERLALMQAQHPTSLKSRGNSLNWILVISHWCECSGFVMGPAILADDVGTTLREYVEGERFKKPKVLWILMED